MLRPTFTNLKGLGRLGFGVAALGVTAAVALPVFAGSASAAQVTSRYIKMSSSATGTVAAGQNVTYEVGFTLPAGSIPVEGVVVDFCDNNPLIGTACTAPNGVFTVGTPTVATTGGANTGLGAGWTAASANSGRTLELTNATGPSLNGVPVIFTLTTATNPTHVTNDGTFYARILVFSDSTHVDTWDNTADGSATANVVHSGGVALSTTPQLDVTAKIQETLSFCVYVNANCAAGGTAVAVGDTNGVLTTSGPFVDKLTKYRVSTNANGGATIRFKAGLPTSGGNTLASIGTSPTSSAAGTSQFGLCSHEDAGTTGLTIDTTYAGGSGACSTTTQTAGGGVTGGTGTAQFAFDTNGTTGSTSTFGESLAVKAAGEDSLGYIAFVGNTSPTQAAGIYTNTFTFIATGTY